ncbi:MAG: hypothetical protein GXP31_16415 [Kiritimatiellaeota bacterium]|nr:hypothetical protein [Kiritimatiellota bacterium]
MNTERQTVSALLNLLQDENVKVASLAMEQLLKLGTAAEQAIAEHQEAQDPHLRTRIHQLSTILGRRRARLEFIQAVRNENVDLWEGVLWINALYDPDCRLDLVNDTLTDLRARVGPGTPSTPRLAALMRDQEFAVPDQDVLDVDLFLAERVLETRFGSPAVLCPLALEIGAQTGWRATIVLFEGRFCLVDRNHLLLDPGNDWHVVKLGDTDRFHPCARKHIWLGILAQLFLVCLVDGHLRDLHHFGVLLTALNDSALDALPHPLGECG